MSVETSAWAKIQTCGDVTTKAVLVELANWARADGICQFRAVPDIARVIEASDRSVQRALKKLEQERDSGGLGLIRRVHRRRDDGGQASNCFELVGYIYPGDKLSPTPGDNLTPGGDRLSPGPRQRVTPPGDNLSPQIKNLDLDLNKNPPSPPAGGSERVAIPDDWVLPGIGDLPDAIGALARQWPDNAYAAEGEAFRQHWRGRGTKRADWAACWAARVQARHAEVMRAAKNGVVYLTAPSAAASAAAVVANAMDRPALAAKGREDLRSAELHGAVCAAIGETLWRTWIEPCALVFDDAGLTVVAPSQFHAAQIETAWRQDIDKALGALGRGVDWLRAVSATGKASAGGVGAGKASRGRAA